MLGFTLCVRFKGEFEIRYSFRIFIMSLDFVENAINVKGRSAPKRTNPKLGLLVL